MTSTSGNRGTPAAPPDPPASVAPPVPPVMENPPEARNPMVTQAPPQVSSIQVGSSGASTTSENMDLTEVYLVDTLEADNHQSTSGLTPVKIEGVAQSTGGLFERASLIIQPQVMEMKPTLERLPKTRWWKSRSQRVGVSETAVTLPRRLTVVRTSLGSELWTCNCSAGGSMGRTISRLN